MTVGRTLESACQAIVDCEHKTAPIDNAGDFFAVGTPAMRGNIINYEECRRISKATFGAWTRRLEPRVGDLLFAREAPVGPIVRIPPEENVAPGQRTVLLRPDPEIIDSDFLFYLLASPRQQARIASKAAGSTVAHLNVADVRAFALPTLPPIPEQRAIAEVLGALDDKIAANATLVQVADALGAALTRNAMTGGCASLSNVADIVMGSSPPGTSYNESCLGTVFYQGVRDFGARTPTNRVWTTEPVRLAAVTDTLVSVRAPVGRTNLVSEETCIGRGLAAVRSRDSRPMTLFHALRDAPEVWAPFESEGTVFGSINKKQLASIQVGVVETSRQAPLEAQLAALEDRIAAAIHESERLAETRDALLPGLMSGAIRVRGRRAGRGGGGVT